MAIATNNRTDERVITKGKIYFWILIFITALLLGYSLFTQLLHPSPNLSVLIPIIMYGICFYLIWVGHRWASLIVGSIYFLIALIILLILAGRGQYGALFVAILPLWMGYMMTISPSIRAFIESKKVQK